MLHDDITYGVWEPVGRDTIDDHFSDHELAQKWFASCFVEQGEC